jgi:VWFA-related protein
VLIAIRQPEPQQPRPTFKAGADFIRVDVFATRDGTPIHDLQREDFEVLEDGRPQKVATFEHVLVRAAGPQTTRVEPNTVRQSEAMAADPRARVFALFLDTHHVTVEGSHNIRRPLIDMLDRVLGQDDLVGVMTPYDSAKDLTLARKTTMIEGLLTREWAWGERDRETNAPRDPTEDNYRFCYPEHEYGTLAADLIDRRREKRTLDALRDLIVHLSGIREERKAILVVTDGWLLYRPDSALTRLRNDRDKIPGPQPIYVGPEGKMTAGTDPRLLAGPQEACSRDRLFLSMLDNERDFRDLMDVANRANASFYPIDPRGLTMFDTSIGSIRAREGIVADSRRLRGREESVRTMAGATDGLAVVGSNDIDSGLRKVSADLSSYYLLGYYSPAGTDGKYHAITVRVKRPGVSVRSRRGYRAAKVEEVTASATSSAAAPASTAVTDAIGSLATVRPGVRLHVRAAAEPRASGETVSVVGEIDPAIRSEWAMGGSALVEVVSKEGRRLASEEATFPAGKHAFLTAVAVPGGLTQASYTIRVRVRPLETGGLPVQDSLDVSVARTPDGAIQPQPLVFRRGPTTGVEFVPAADPRVRRSDRLRVELALPPAASKVGARLLDRNGKLLPVPVTLGQRPDPDGSTRATGDLTLAPLAMGDYLIEMSYDVAGSTQRVLTAIRVVP